MSESRIDRITRETQAWSEKNQAEGGVCDFCCTLLVGMNVVTWITEKPIIESMLVLGGAESGVIDNVSDEYWAACPACDPVIQFRDRARLAKHVAETADYSRIGVERDPGEEARLTAFYERFFAAKPRRDVRDPIAEGLRELQGVAANTHIYGFEYPDYDTAKAAFERAKPLVDTGGSAGGASLWIARDGETESRIFLWIADTDAGVYEKNDWGEGRLVLPSARERQSLLDRHLGIILENYDPAEGASHLDVRYGLGAELRPGNNMRVRVGGED